MISPTNLHPGLVAQHQKLRNMGIVLSAFILLSFCDLIPVINSKDPGIIQWRPAIEPALFMVMVVAPVLLYSLVWTKLKALWRASAVVQSTASRPMLLRVWKQDNEKNRLIYFFELQPEEQFGCVTASFVIVTEAESKAALPLYCEQSWKSKEKSAGVVKAFVDDRTGLPVALQTIDALEWVGINVYMVKPDDKDRMLQKRDSQYQLSGDAK